jgi:hypothetical protein
MKVSMGRNKFAGVFYDHLKANLLSISEDKVEAYRLMENSLRNLLKELKNMSSEDEEDCWAVPAFLEMLKRLGKLAYELQDVSVGSSSEMTENSETYAESYGRMIIDFIREFRTLSARFKASGSMAVVLILFRFGFEVTCIFIAITF